MILKLILHKYKRLFLGGIDHLEYTPETKAQIILGINGSGKSSLLSQLTELPPDLNKEYRDDGYKYLEKLHNGKVYKLSSGMIGKNKHSFVIDDGPELNTNGKITVQRELVREHFGVTPPIQEILLGNKTFTSMSTNERKKWLTEISPVDYRYSIMMWNKVRSRHRDVKGAIKIAQSDIIRLENDTLSKDEVSALIKEKENLTSLLEHTISLLSHDVTTEADIEGLLAKIEANTVLLRKATHDGLTLNNKQAAVDEVTELTNINKHLISTNEELGVMIDSLEQKASVDKDKQLILKDLSEILRKLEDLGYTDKIEIPENSTKLYEFLSSNYSSIVSILNSLTEYRNTHTTRSNVADKTNLKNRLVAEINLATNSISVCKTIIAEQEELSSDDNKVTCGQCGHNWKVGFDKNKLEEARNKLKKNKDKKHKYEQELVVVEDWLTKATAKINIIMSLKAYMDMVELKSFWSDVFKTTNPHNSDPSEIFSSFEEQFRIVQDFSTVDRLIYAKEEKQSLLDQISKNETMSNEVVKKAIDTHMAVIDNNIEKVNQNNKRISSLRLTIALVTKLLEARNQLKSDIKAYYKAKKKLVDGVRNEYLNKYIIVVKEELNIIVTKLNDMSIHEAKLKSDKANLDSLVKTEEVLSAMETSLSPTEGLIAKSINSFLNVFLSDINALINEVWGYHMEVKPSDISTGNDLNYLFKVVVKDNDPVDDISKGSSSMQDMINLAFRIVFTKYMGLNHVPLYLDEFGRTFDAKHQITAYEIVDRILMDKFNQVFIVSHFESMYGRFKNADVNILGTNNDVNTDIIRYNQNLKIN